MNDPQPVLCPPELPKKLFKSTLHPIVCNLPFSPGPVSLLRLFMFTFCQKKIRDKFPKTEKTYQKFIWCPTPEEKNSFFSTAYLCPRLVGCYKAFLFGAFYKMSDPRPVSCLLRSGTKRCSGEEIVFFFHHRPPPSLSLLPPINLLKRPELEDCLLLAGGAIPGYVLSNPWEKTFSHFFCPPALQLGFFSPLVGLYQIPVIFGRKEGNLSWRGCCTSKYRVSGKTAAIITYILSSSHASDLRKRLKTHSGEKSK